MSQCLINISYVLIRPDTGGSCCELQARMRRCQRGGHMPGPRGGLRFTDWTLITMISGVRAKWLVRCQKEECLRVWTGGSHPRDRGVTGTHSESKERGINTASESRRPPTCRQVSGCHVPSALREPILEPI